MSVQVPADGWTYLRSYLAPLRDLLDRPDVTDIYVNRPEEIWVETIGGAIERQTIPALDATVLVRLVRQVAAFSHQGISREHPLLSASLPDGSRIQVVAPPATRGDLALAIRKHVSVNLAIEDYLAAGRGRNSQIGSAADRSMPAMDIEEALAKKDYGSALRVAVRMRHNILVSGGTSTGKTTFLNALIREMQPEERLITIEDTPELVVQHANSVGLLATRGGLGEAQVTADDLVTASLRMRPDRIILGELRGTEAYAFLRAVNTGHPGSMTTIHANSCESAVEQLVLLILQGGTGLSRQDVQDYVRSTIGIFVHLDRTAGRRQIAEVVSTREMC